LSPTAHVVLCADDFGLTEGVSRGILELGSMGRLSATSAMTNCPAFPRMAPGLADLDGRIAVGLHLNLTTGAPLGPMPAFAPDRRFPQARDVVRRAFTGRLPLEEISDEIARQLDAFEMALGRAPDFADGHNHVHLLPGVRSALLRALRERAPGAWVRDAADRLGAILRRRVSVRKALTVQGFAMGFGAAARRHGIDANEGFSGFSPFDAKGDPARIFKRALKFLGPRPLVMCHPGYVDDELRRLDTVVETRPQELAFLASDAFPALLDRRGVELAPSP
jgi:chitin disaccharide deacetylase